MAAAPTAQTDAALLVIAELCADPEAPLSAWPDRFPGRWVTAAQVAERLGTSAARLQVVIRALVENECVKQESPWPGNVRGYQPAPNVAIPVSARDAVDPFAPSEPIELRAFYLAALTRWAESNGGRAPSRGDWSPQRDPDHRWPRAQLVADFFETEARKVGARRFVPERCSNCTCRTGRHYSNGEGSSLCTGCFDCRGECPHGDSGEWEGPSGWLYALELAGLSRRAGGDHHATASQSLGRNRQMVTGGIADQHSQHFSE